VNGTAWPYRRGQVAAVIPVHAPNVANGMLIDALVSVTAQSRPVDAIHVAVDTEHDGAAVTRTRALAGVTAEWAAFLDSDDRWYPHHVEALLETARDTNADVVYPWFDLPVGTDPFPQYEGREFDAETIRSHQNYIPITVLARTSLLHHVGGFEHRGDPGNPCEDWGMWIKCLNEGAKFVHHYARTWEWRWHGGNTSGSGSAW
jgi:glycosyltransferase involved in cell wall biosynthesis